MRKIDLTPYEIQVQDSTGKPITRPYDVKESIVLALYSPELKLGSRDLLDNDRVAQKIKGSNGSVLLEDAEYARIEKAFNAIHGFDLHDVELVKRVLNAPEVPVKEAV